MRGLTLYKPWYHQKYPNSDTFTNVVYEGNWYLLPSKARESIGAGKIVGWETKVIRDEQEFIND